jgi:glycosyltransferase involved in cell wall biosynthesis
VKILIATDAWQPQINGVVRTLSSTVDQLTELGHAVMVIEPSLFLSFPCVVYPEIQLALPPESSLQRMIGRFAPDHIHIATEGPIGLQVRRYCQTHELRFTTSYHTKFPDYLWTLLGVPSSLSYCFLRWFHAASSAIMLSTPSLERELRAWGFRNQLLRWSRAVDTRLFHPRRHTYAVSQRPILMYVGRVSREKNVEAFLQLATPGTKYVVGDGPARVELEQKYPQAVFLGPLTGQSLAEAYANADVFVFPSRTDTFGLVILEALASGVPVAAYPVPGPIDILQPPLTGALHDDLNTAITTALRYGDREACVALAARYSWEKCTRQFLGNLVPVRAPSPRRALSDGILQLSLAMS